MSENLEPGEEASPAPLPLTDRQSAELHGEAPLRGPDKGITLRWQQDTALLRPALNAWWESAVPRPSISYRLVFWTLVWIGLLIATIALGALGLGPSYIVAGVAGVAVFVIGFFTLQRTRLRAFYRVLGTHYDVAAETVGVFSPEGVRLSDAVSTREIVWRGIDAIQPAKDATVLRTGIAMVAVPDAALPDGLSGRGFRAQLRTWKAGG